MSTNVTIHREFLITLQRAWPTREHQFSMEDELFFKENLIFFCNTYKEYSFSGGDFQTIYQFLDNSLINFLDLSLKTPSDISYIQDGFTYLLTFVKHLFIHYNNKVTTRNFFKKFLNTILTYPDKLTSSDEEYLIMELYDSTDLLHCICHYMTTLIILDVEEDVLSQFMKKVRLTPQSRLFRFYLYPFNNRYFRCNYPSFPDECNARELYYGVFYGYFSLTYNSEVYKLMLSMCEDVPDYLANKKTHNNPLYNYYILSETSSHLSITDIYKPLGRLFHD